MDIKTRRTNSGMNQTEFWAIFGVQQNMGSRYERGLAIPLPVRLLMALYFAGNSDLFSITIRRAADRIQEQ